MKILNLNIAIGIDNTENLMNLIKNEQVDICAFQEVMNGAEESCFKMYKTRNELANMKEYPFSEFAPLFIANCITKNGIMIRDFGGKAEQGSMILSKYKIKEHYNQFYYNDYKYEYDATHFHEKDWCRSIQNAIIDINGAELQIINVHGIWNKDKIGDERTIVQSEFILSKIRNDIPSIVLGDFNLLPDTQSIKMINEKMNNLIEIFNIKTTRPEYKGNFVCDYVFVNDKVKINSFKTINSNVSDHLPIILDFEI